MKERGMTGLVWELMIPLLTIRHNAVQDLFCWPSALFSTTLYWAQLSGEESEVLDPPKIARYILNVDPGFTGNY
jgi:hypothetical protein